MAGASAGQESLPPQWLIFADFVRRALHAAADQVEPRADGLAPIQARILAEGKQPGPFGRKSLYR